MVARHFLNFLYEVFAELAFISSLVILKELRTVNEDSALGFVWADSFVRLDAAYQEI